MPENEINKAKSVHNKALLAAGLMTAAGILGGCDNGTTTPAPETKKCECPETAHKNLPTDVCCDGEDCVCTVKRVYNLTFGKRPVVLNVPESGLAQDTVDAIQERLTLISNSNTNGIVAFHLNRPGILTINIIDDDSLPIPVNLDSFSVGKVLVEEDMDYIAWGFNRIYLNKDRLSLMQQFNRSKNTIQLSRANTMRPQRMI
ncbi:MAG: hypothetical protein LBQ35_05180 [Spirochaetaceae bacterium]|jgi:hypothetical protein|nr:hypothetical protein [Spirochaetaceae bacterium]